MNRLILTTLVAITTLGAGCATTSTSPYAEQPDARRDTVRAQSLTQKAAALIEDDPEKADELLREALTADLYHGPAHNNLGVLYLQEGKLYEAANKFERAKKLMPGHPDPRMNLALTLEHAGRMDEALATYGTALEVYPNHLPTMQALARLQVRSGKTDDRTRRFLEEISLRGETAEWREWAQAVTRGM
ncbi:MAG: tetratricopeptide repeat protein [Planctomycetes bacterium]|nr:tetratricopeptide repeat protein [Planctomycetota bacterium]